VGSCFETDVFSSLIAGGCSQTDQCNN